MNTLNQISKQIRDLFESMTPSARIMSAVMLGLIVISFGWIMTATSSTSTEYLFGGRDFTDTELELWEATFGEAELRTYERIGKRIRVPSAEKDLYLKALSSANALPREWGSYIDEAMNNGSPFDPNSLIERRVEVGRERELASIIRRIPGIEYAAVEFDEHRQGFGRKSERVCSISVQGHGKAAVDSAVLKQISLMASNYFAGLAKENITVIDLNTTNVYRSTGDASAPEENPYLAAQAQWEKLYKEKVAAVLSNFGNIALGVNVELDPKLTEQTERLQYEPTAVTVQSSATRNDTENLKSPPAGPPGTASNSVSNQAQSIAAAPPGQSSKTKQSEETEKRLPSHSAIVTTTAGLVPRKIKVTVGIPDSYFRQVWDARYMRDNPTAKPSDKPSPPANEIAAIESEVYDSVRKAVAGIPVGIREGDDSKPYTEVYSYTELPLPAIEGPSLGETALAWFGESWSTLALIGLVLVSLWMMAGFVKSQGESDTERKFAEGFGLEVPANLQDELEISGGDGDPELLGADVDGRKGNSFEFTGEQMRDDLSTLIKENPEIAANLLKTWIGEAA